MSISGHSPQGNSSNAHSDSSQPSLHNLADAAGSTLQDAMHQGAEQVENLREHATDQIDVLVEGAQSAAAALEGKDDLGLSQYLGQLATGLSTFADKVRDKSAEDLLQEGARLARDNPALFVAGSVAIGFGLSRFLRASASKSAEPAEPTPTAVANPSSSRPDTPFVPHTTAPTPASPAPSVGGSVAGATNDGLLTGDLRGNPL